MLAAGLILLQQLYVVVEIVGLLIGVLVCADWWRLLHHAPAMAMMHSHLAFILNGATSTHAALIWLFEPWQAMVTFHSCGSGIIGLLLLIERPIRAIHGRVKAVRWRYAAYLRRWQLVERLGVVIHQRIHLVELLRSESSIIKLVRDHIAIFAIGVAIIGRFGELFVRKMTWCVQNHVRVWNVDWIVWQVLRLQRRLPETFEDFILLTRLRDVITDAQKSLGIEAVFAQAHTHGIDVWIVEFINIAEVESRFGDQIVDLLFFYLGLRRLRRHNAQLLTWLLFIGLLVEQLAKYFVVLRSVDIFDAFDVADSSLVIVANRVAFLGAHGCDVAWLICSIEHTHWQNVASFLPDLLGYDFQLLAISLILLIPVLLLHLFSIQSLVFSVQGLQSELLRRVIDNLILILAQALIIDFFFDIECQMKAFCFFAACVSDVEIAQVFVGILFVILCLDSGF